jgi:hypothetical protein
MDDNEEDIFPTLVKPESPPPIPQQETILIDEEGEISDEDVMPDVKPREIIDQKEIFVNKKVKININDEEIPLTIQPVKKEKKKRKPMTEEHKKKLALARDKANATRKANALRRKADKDLDNEEIELTKKIKQKRVQKMKQMVEDKPTPTRPQPIARPTLKPTPAPAPMGFSQDDLNKAVIEGIAGYEIMRKERKEVKKKKNEIDQHKQKVFNTINKAVSGNPELDQWSNCFQ